LHTDQHGERQVAARSSTEAACATPAASGRSVDGGGGALLSRHLDFLSGVLSLNTVATARAQYSTSPPTHVVSATVQHVLDFVLRRLERCHDDDDDDDVMSHSAAVHAVNVVARVADVVDADFCDAVRKFARNVIATVMNSPARLSQVLLRWSLYTDC